jgi:pSer/pThr/pTyr-binding forkhead associated (FHA) protein
MQLIKLCPACGEKNPVSEIMCRICMTDISSVSPTAPDSDQKESPAERNAGETIISAEVLTLSRAADGRVLPVQSGYILGRGGHAAAFFEDSATVSRQHAQIHFQDGVWNIEDLGSTNGTWINGRRAEPGRPHVIKKGDTISLSLACELRVIS